LILSTASFQRASGTVTRVGMPPPSPSSSTKSQPDENDAAIVALPESRTIETGAIAWPARRRSVLS
jgi:hypothetical protein